MAAKPAIPGPRLGPYCCFTGRYVRPLAQRIVFFLFHVLAVGLIVALCAYHLADSLGGVQALGIGALAAVAYLITLLLPRVHFVALWVLLGLSIWSAVIAWNEERPIRLVKSTEEAHATPSDPLVDRPDASLEVALEGALPRIDRTLGQIDEFFLQAAKVAAFPLACASFAVLAALVVLFTLVALGRSRKLPRRIWFVRFHPVWRRAYAPGESPHPVVGIAYVAHDTLLAEKLLFLKLDRGANALRFQSVSGVDSTSAELASGASSERIPLSNLEDDLALCCDGGRWHVVGNNSSQALRLRLLLRRPHQGSQTLLEDARWSTAANLPVRDLFSADNTVYGKTYQEPQDTELLGVLLDSRPNYESGASALPRFTLLVQRAGRVFCEYPHPDLLGLPYREEADGRVHLPWRGPDEEPLDLVVDPHLDSLHALGTHRDGYFLFFLAFGDNPIGLRTALGLTRADESRGIG